MKSALTLTAVLLAILFCAGCASRDGGFSEGKAELSPEQQQQLDQSQVVQDPDDAVIEKPQPAPDGE